MLQTDKEFAYILTYSETMNYFKGNALIKSSGRNFKVAQDSGHDIYITGFFGTKSQKYLERKTAQQKCLQFDQISLCVNGLKQPLFIKR